MLALDAADVIVVARGHVAQEAKELGREALARVSERVDGPVLLARITLTEEADPARERPSVAQGTLDVNGRMLRAHVAAPTMAQAIAGVEVRLRDRLEHYERPRDERELVRHKSYSLDALSIDEAVTEMDLLDHDFHLFVDAATGNDAIVRALSNGEIELVESPLPSQEVVIEHGLTPVRLSTEPIPTLHISEALEMLGFSGATSLFFANASTGRGNVVYMRYDGHFGLISPAPVPRGWSPRHDM